MRKMVAWRVGPNSEIQRLEDDEVQYERDLESWIERDPDIVAEDLLLIGRQQTTDFGTYVDLLGLNAEGDLVILELKRDRTLREIVAQSLEYAAWASRLSYERILEIAAASFGSEGKFREAFRARFNTDLPDTVNQSQRIILIAPQVSDAVRAVIEYLAETFGVPINAATFSLVRVGDSRVLMRELVIADGETVPAVTSKKRPAPSMEELMARADENGVREIAEIIFSLQPHFRAPWRYTHSWALARFDLQKRRPISAFTVFPTAETKPRAVVINISPKNLHDLFGPEQKACQAFVARMKSDVGQPEPSAYRDWESFSFNTPDQARRFVREFSEFAGLPAVPGA